MWLLKLKRMLDEVPQEFLESIYPDIEISDDMKKVGELTEEEKRIFGVVRQMYRMIRLEAEAHQVLHLDPDFSPESCLKHNIANYVRDMEAGAVILILALSLKERLGLPESDFVFMGDTIYSKPDVNIEKMKSDFRAAQRGEQNSNKILDNYFDSPSDPEDEK